MATVWSLSRKAIFGALMPRADWLRASQPTPARSAIHRSRPMARRLRLPLPTKARARSTPCPSTAAFPCAAPGTPRALARRAGLLRAFFSTRPKRARTFPPLDSGVTISRLTRAVRFRSRSVPRLRSSVNHPSSSLGLPFKAATPIVTPAVLRSSCGVLRCRFLTRRLLRPSRSPPITPARVVGHLLGATALRSSVIAAAA